MDTIAVIAESFKGHLSDDNYLKSLLVGQALGTERLGFQEYLGT